jgi:hypothetical protein
MPNQPKTPTRSIRVGDDLWFDLREVAKLNGTTVTAVLVAAGRDYVKRHKLAVHRAAEASRKERQQGTRAKRAGRNT